jgi:hypothetical protein
LTPKKTDTTYNVIIHWASLFGSYSSEQHIKDLEIYRLAGKVIKKINSLELNVRQKNMAEREIYRRDY